MILFLNQGQAAPNAAMGYLRVAETTRRRTGGSVVTLKRFSVPERALIFPLPIGSHGGWSAPRWFTLRSVQARLIVERRLRAQETSSLHVTTSHVSLFLGSVFEQLPVALSADVTLVDWLMLQRGLPKESAVPSDLEWLHKLERKAWERCALAIAWMPSIAERIRAIAPATKRIEVLHPGIDVELFSPRPAPPSGHLRILFVGGRFAAKGGHDLVAAFADIPGSLELHIVTTESTVFTDPRIFVHKAAAGSAELIALYRSADVFCLPSRLDAVPFVIAEALACGVPVVASNVGSIPDMVPQGCGRMVNPGCQEELKAALQEILDSPSARHSMSACCRSQAEALYDSASNSDRLVQLLEGLAA